MDYTPTNTENPGRLENLMRFPVVEPLTFTIYPRTNIVKLDPLLVNLLRLPGSVMPDSGAGLISKLLDHSDRTLCQDNVEAVIRGERSEYRQFGRMMIYDEVFWIKLAFKAMNSGTGQRVVKGFLDIFNFHRVLTELLRQMDCGHHNRNVLLHFAKVPIDTQVALLDCADIPYEPEQFCREFLNPLDESLFAEPLCDGYVLTAFRCDTVCFEERLKRLSSEATLRSPTTFFSGRSENFTDALTLRARFLRRLSALIQVEEGLTLTNIVDLTVATRHNFSGFRLHFQPQVNEAGYCGGEFLVRVSSKWEKNPVRPDLFIPILEKTPLIQPFGRWVVEASMDQARLLTSKFKTDFTVSFNMSAFQAADIGFVPFVNQSLIRFKIPAAHVMLELTETARPFNLDQLRRQVEALRALGLQTAIDDFGTGFNSFEALFLIPFNMVKFSREFIWTVIHDQEHLNFFAKLVDACHALKLRVCAEGVENAEMHRHLKAVGVDLFQGYYFASPSPISDAVSAMQASPVTDGILPDDGLLESRSDRP